MRRLGQHGKLSALGAAFGGKTLGSQRFVTSGYAEGHPPLRGVAGMTGGLRE